MYITNIDEAVPALRERLRDYLVLKLGIDPHAKSIKCFIHNDSNPSMHFNPKTNDQTVHCFSCGAQADIFAAASHLEGLPENGPDWITTTIPHLAELLKIPIQTGETSVADREKLKLYRLAEDIAMMLSTTVRNQEYLEERNWLTDDITIGSIAEETLISALLEKGWDSNYLISSRMLKTHNTNFFGEDKITFTIRDFRGRAVGFVSRNINTTPKYINTAETLIYEKRKSLLGFDVAIRKGQAKKNGLYIVEGPGDLAQLYRIGIFNAVAICGTAFTQDHITILKMLGISKLFLCLDWDAPGVVATSRILKQELSGIQGISCHVIQPPEDKNLTDLDEYLKDKKLPEQLYQLEAITGFQWLMENISDNQDPQQTCAELIPSIASEVTAISRDQLIKILAQHTGVSYHAIAADVETIRSGKHEERRERLLAAAKKYMRDIESDPDNLQALMSQHEDDVSNIEKEYQKDVIGVNYQLARYDALQSNKLLNEDGSNSTEFLLNRFTYFRDAFSGGMSWTSGVVIYLGGRANSGKTATGIALATDIAMSDPDTIVLCHFTDDSYVQVEPRIKSNISSMINDSVEQLTIGQVANPYKNCRNQDKLDLYTQADNKFRELIASEKMIIIDMEDGSTLSVLEKNLKYIRARFPSKKVFVFCDNTHNYRDFPNLDATSRMSRISTLQKDLSAKYHCCLMATVEYRKNMPFDTTKIKFPVDDDIADARALMYRPNAIIHVYNDMHDRKEASEIFWTKDGTTKMPRLLLLITKNKISAFKDNLTMDMDTESVTLKQKHKDEARAEFASFLRGEDGENEPAIYIDTDYED